MSETVGTANGAPRMAAAGPLDVGLIYFRRHLALRARDYQRLGSARGALKSPPRAGTISS